jgi:hypothetical protein
MLRNRLFFGFSVVLGLIILLNHAYSQFNNTYNYNKISNLLNPNIYLGNSFYTTISSSMKLNLLSSDTHLCWPLKMSD